MKAAVVLIIMLSNQGYWFGGAEGRVSLRWALEAPMPQAVLEWELMADSVQLAHGESPLPEAKEPAAIRLKTPEVRRRTSVRFVYKLFAAADKQEITHGEARIDLFPKNLWAGFPKRFERKMLLVVDEAQGLPQLLGDQKVAHKAVDAVEKLPIARPDIILVGPDKLVGAPFEQNAIMGQCEAGASVMIFRQTKVDALGEYPLRERRIFGAAGGNSSPLEMRVTHPLLLGLDEHDIRSWIEQSVAMRAIALPADEPALEIVFWPRETPGKEPAPIDAVLVSKAVGKGRLVLCQIPIGNWNTDPRSQLFLANALDYLLSRPEPTPRPGEREEHPQPLPTTVPSIMIPSGANP